jgi:hypothetical protein
MAYALGTGDNTMRLAIQLAFQRHQAPVISPYTCIRDTAYTIEFLLRGEYSVVFLFCTARPLSLDRPRFEALREESKKVRIWVMVIMGRLPLGFDTQSPSACGLVPFSPEAPLAQGCGIQSFRRQPDCTTAYGVAISQPSDTIQTTVPRNPVKRYGISVEPAIFRTLRQCYMVL